MSETVLEAVSRSDPRSKSSVAADLRLQSDRDTPRNLVPKPDVVAHALAPVTTDEWDYEALSQNDPSIIYRGVSDNWRKLWMVSA
jgi:crotonobetainyl-CoA:carnitine CoA-transferase CaiB-like acyl-CoA transferase